MFKSLRHRKRIPLILSVLALVLIIFLLGARALLTPYPASAHAISLLNDTESYHFTKEKYLAFTPQQSQNDVVGYIVYPGGLVSPEAYAPLCAAIASSGYLCVIYPMPLNLAVLNPNAATDVIADYSHVVRWIMVGHSLGGAMAARFVDSNPGQISALALLGAYSDVDIRGDVGEAMVFVASEDKVLNRDNLARNAENLPEGTETVSIKGGNHAGFGDYGPQNGDGEALISKELQLQIVVDALIDLAR